MTSFTKKVTKNYSQRYSNIFINVYLFLLKFVLPLLSPSNLTQPKRLNLHKHLYNRKIFVELF